MAEVDGGGDERPRAGRGDPEHPGTDSRLHGGRDSERVATRAALASCGGARVVAVPEKSRGPKNDEWDAWARAEELRTGAIRTRVYKAPLHLSALRNAARAYGMAVQDVVRVENCLKAVLRSRSNLCRGFESLLTRLRPRRIQQTQFRSHLSARSRKWASPRCHVHMELSGAAYSLLESVVIRSRM